MYHVLTFVEIWIKNNVDKFLRFFNWCCWVNRNGTKLTDSPKITKIIPFTVKSHHPRLDWLKKWMDSKILKWIISQSLFCLFYSSLLFVVLSSHIKKVLYYSRSYFFCPKRERSNDHEDNENYGKIL